jgi:protein gp37
MSGIEWTSETWNSVVGCQRVSPGCEHCYAERIAAQRLEPNEKAADYDGIAERTDAGPRWTGRVDTLPHKLDEPLSWNVPRRVFVNSMSDLFHPAVPFEFIAAVFGVIARAKSHTFQVLTKRPNRIRKFFKWLGEPVHHEHLNTDRDDYTADAPAPVRCIASWAYRKITPHESRRAFTRYSAWDWPLPNVWLGVSAEDQQRADERIPTLLKCPAAVRFVSCEPLLARTELDRIEIEPDARDGLDWVIVGGESGPEARSCHVDHIREIVDDCEAADVPVFVKQLGANPIHDLHDPELIPAAPIELDDPKGGDPDEWPDDLQRRECPEGTL